MKLLIEKDFLMTLNCKICVMHILFVILYTTNIAYLLPAESSSITEATMLRKTPQPPTVPTDYRYWHW